MALIVQASGFESDGRWYLSLLVGTNNVDALETKNWVAPEFDVDLDFSYGALVGGTFGRSFGESYRLEAELGYRANEASSLGDGNPNLYGDVNMDGDLKVFNSGLNGYYDPQFEFWVEPYIGGGFGIARFAAEVYQQGSGDVRTWEENDTAGYMQGMAGLSRSLGTNNAITLEYRYFRSIGLDASSRYDWGVSPSNDSEYASHSVIIGLRAAF